MHNLFIKCDDADKTTNVRGTNETTETTSVRRTNDTTQEFEGRQLHMGNYYQLLVREIFLLTKF